MTRPVRRSSSSSRSKPARTWRRGTRWVPPSGWPLVWVEEYAVARTLLTWAVGRAAGGWLAAPPAAVADRAVGARLPGRPLGAGSRRSLRGDRAVRGDRSANRARVRAGDDRQDRGRARSRRGLPTPRAGGLRRRCRVRPADGERATPARRSASWSWGAASRSRDRGARTGGAHRARERSGRALALQWAPDLVEACSHAGRTDRAAEVLEAFERAGAGHGPHLRAGGRGALPWAPGARRRVRAALRCRTRVARPRTDAVRARPDRARLRRAATADAEAIEGARAAADGAPDVRAARRGALGGARPQRASCLGSVGANTRAAGGRRAHAAGAAGRRARRRRSHEPRSSGGPVPQREDDRVPPRARLPQARHPLPDRARARVWTLRLS